ncbi:MAG: ubiquinol cytochrome C oxidoreductase [Bacteroidota bacterium]
MKPIVSSRQRYSLFNILMFSIAFTFPVVWLPFLRCLFDGKSYSWGQTYFGKQLYSEGIAPDYIWLIIFLVFYVFLFYSFYWLGKRIIFYVLLLIWWLHSFGNLWYDIIKNGDTMFHGDTLNVHISLTGVIAPISIVAAVLIIMVILKDRKMPDFGIAWGKRNTFWAFIILGPLVAQIFLFVMGEPHGTTDEIGVVIAILQALLFPLIFLPPQLKM